MWLHSCPSASHQGYVAFSTSALLPWLMLKYIRVGDICFIGCIVFTNKILQLKNAGWPDLLKRLWDSFTNGEIKCWYNILTSASLNVTSSRSTNSPGTKSGWLGGIHNNALFFFFFSCLSHRFVWFVRKIEEENWRGKERGRKYEMEGKQQVNRRGWKEKGKTPLG